MFKKIVISLLLINLSTNYLKSATLDINIVKKGTVDNEILMDNRVIVNDKDLDEIKKLIKDNKLGKDVNFDNELLLLISAKDRNAVNIKIDKIERRSGDILHVIYSVEELNKLKISKLGIAKYPYLIARINKTNGGYNEVIFRENLKVPPIPAGTALDEDIKYSNILSTYQNLQILEYIPLDVGNKWSYKIEKGSKTYEITQEIQSISNGWSILNSYFGKPNIAMKIDEGGNLFISSKEAGVRSFYNDTVIKTFNSDDIETPAGKFYDLMVVTVPDNENFWFKDIYAKGVGLIYHEHRSSKGNATYTLLDAQVKGIRYPQ